MRTLIALILVSICSPCLAQDVDANTRKAAENKAKLEARREAKKKSIENRLRLHNAQQMGVRPALPQAAPPQARPAVPPAVPRVYQEFDPIHGFGDVVATDGRSAQFYSWQGRPLGSAVMNGQGGVQFFNWQGQPVQSIVPLR